MRSLRAPPHSTRLLPVSSEWQRQGGTVTGNFTVCRAKLVRMSTEDHSNPSLFERILAYLTVAVIIVALGSFFSTLIVGLNDREAATGGFAQVAYAISLFALPIGFVFLVLLLILAQIRRKRDAGSGKK